MGDACGTVQRKYKLLRKERKVMALRKQWRKRFASLLLSGCMAVSMLAAFPAIAPQTTFAAEDGLTNVALGKQVTATDVNKDTNPACVTDDKFICEKPTDYLEIGTKGPQDPENPSYVQVDLGKVYEVERINMWRYYNTELSAPRQYKNTIVFASEDMGLSADDIVYNADRDNFFGFGAGTEEDYTETKDGKEIVLEQPKKARYIYVINNGSSLYSEGGHFVEIQAWAKEEEQPEGLVWEDVPALSGSITYDDGWTMRSQEQIALTYKKGAKASLTFYGTGIRWIGQKDINFGTAIVTLDGETTEVNTNGSALWGITHFEKTGLTEGVHTISIEPKDEGVFDVSGCVDVEKFVVQYDTSKQIAPSAISLKASKEVIYTEENLQLTTTLAPYNADAAQVVFTSSDDTVASVDETGKVTGKKAGKVTLTASVAGTEVADSVEVTVKEFARGELRMQVDEEHPLILHQLTREVYKGYTDPDTGVSPPIYGGQTIPEFWANIPDKQKPYSAIIIHPGGSVNSSDAHYYPFLEEQMKIANDNKIPFIINVGCSFTNSFLPNEKLIEYFEKYEYFLGATYSEIHSRGEAKDPIVHKDIADKLKIAAEYGGYFVLAEINDEGDAMERIFNDPVFYSVAELCPENLITLTKTTSAWTTVGYNSFESVAYGSWIAGTSGNWGTLIDSWMWFIENQWKLYAGTRTIMGGPEECRGCFAFPELLYPQRMIQEAMSGGTVFLFEHPFNSEGVRNQLSPTYTEAISKAIDYMLDERIPDRAEMIEKTEIAYDSRQGTLNDLSVRNGKAFSLIGALYGDSRNIPSERDGWSMLTSTSGRYGIVPSIPKLAAEEFFAENPDILRLDADMLLNDDSLNSGDKIRALFNEKYPETYTGDGYAYKLDNIWFTYNNLWEKEGKQSVTLPMNSGSSVSVEYDNFTYLLLEEQDNGTIDVKLNNFLVDKDDIWENYVPWNEGTAENPATPHWDADNDDRWIQYLLTEYFPDETRRDNEYRTTTITLHDQEAAPEVTIVDGMYDTYREANQFNDPVIEYDADSKTATITLESNGWVNFTIETAGEEEADKTALQAAYDEYAKLNEKDYTADSWKAFAEAMQQADAVLKNAQATQQQVDDALNALNAAADALEKATVPQPADKTALQADYDKYSKLSEKDYTAESWKAFAEALQKAGAVLKNTAATQAEVDAALDALQQAAKKLEKPGVPNPDPTATPAPTAAPTAAPAPQQPGSGLPQTGDSGVLAIAVLMAVSAGAAVLLGRRRTER